MSGLIERLEGAEKGSRELDREVARLFGWHRVEPRHARNKHGGWIAPEDFIGLYSDGSPKLDGLHGTSIYRDPPAFTTSLDAALALAERVLPGWYWRAGRTPMGHWHHGRYTYGWAHMSRTDASNCDRGDEATGWAETPALALCAAILRAHEASQ